MAKHKSKLSHRSHHGRRRKNPLAMRHHRRHRNPEFIGMSGGTVVKKGAGAALGLLLDVYGPAAILGLMGKPDSGVLSYLLAAGLVVAPPWLLKKFNMPNLAEGSLYGALAAFIWRAVDDLTGTKYLTVTSGMSSFNFNGYQPLPGPNIFGGYQRGALPPAPSVADAASPAAVSAPVSGLGWVYA